MLQVRDGVFGGEVFLKDFTQMFLVVQSESEAGTVKVPDFNKKLRGLFELCLEAHLAIFSGSICDEEMLSKMRQGCWHEEVLETQEVLSTRSHRDPGFRSRKTAQKRKSIF